MIILTGGKQWKICLSKKKKLNRFEKLRWIVFPVRMKAGVSNLFQFEERFRKTLFSWRISVHDRPNRKDKIEKPNSSYVNG